jgi:hypothetical protein
MYPYHKCVCDYFVFFYEDIGISIFRCTIVKQGMLFNSPSVSVLQFRHYLSGQFKDRLLLQGQYSQNMFSNLLRVWVPYCANDNLILGVLLHVNVPIS